jgi:hypothetical protein
MLSSPREFSARSATSLLWDAAAVATGRGNRKESLAPEERARRVQGSRAGRCLLWSRQAARGALLRCATRRLGTDPPQGPGEVSVEPLTLGKRPLMLSSPREFSPRSATSLLGMQRRLRPEGGIGRSGSPQKRGPEGSKGPARGVAFCEAGKQRAALYFGARSGALDQGRAAVAAGPARGFFNTHSPA